MKNGIQRTEVGEQRSENRVFPSVALVMFLSLVTPGRADDLAALCADRTAFERVYFQHRIGTKQTFEQASPTSLIERLVRDDLHKEAVLKKFYGVEITPARDTLSSRYFKGSISVASDVHDDVTYPRY